MGWPVPPRLPAVVSLTLPIVPAVVTVVLPAVPELELTASESESGTANPGIDTWGKRYIKGQLFLRCTTNKYTPVCFVMWADWRQHLVHPSG